MTIAIPLSLLVFPFAGLLVYWCCLNGPPIFDDNEAVSNTTKYRWEWRYMLGRQRPLTALTFALAKAWPNTMRGIHVFNVFVHCGSAFLVERLAAVLGADEGLALLTGLLFLMHPFAVNAVAYMTWRASILSGFFGLAAALAILSGWPSLAFPLLVLCVAAKEDGAGYVVQSLALMAYRGDYLFAGLLFTVSILFAVKNLHYLRRMLANNGDKSMGEIGLPVSYAQPRHAVTVLVATLSRIPLWALGLGQSCWHGSGIRLTYRDAIAAVACAALAFFIEPVPLVLLAFGPWLVYLACRVPDQIVEYRNYSFVAPCVLVMSGWMADESIFWLPLLFAVASLTAIRASAYSDVLRFWTEAAAHSWGDASRAFQELGAWTKADVKTVADLNAAERYLREAVTLNPQLGPALNNLAWVLIQKRWMQTPQGEPRKIDTEGYELLERCTVACPRYPVGWQDYGIVSEELGFLDIARTAYETALKLHPGMQVSLNRLGMLDFYANDPAGALKHFEEVTALNPSHWEYTYNKGVAMKHAGQKEEGQKILNSLPQPCPVTHNMIRVEFAK